jgi:aspartate/glutamate racemase
MSIIEIQDLCNNKIVFESCTGSLKSQNKEYQIKKAKIYLSDNNDVIMEGCSDNIFISQDEDKVSLDIY